MSVFRKVFSDSAFTAFRSIVSVLRGIIIIPLITNILGAGSYGVWVTILAVVGLLRSTGGMHLHGSLVRFLPQETKKNQTYSDILSLAIVIGSALFILIIFMSNFVDFSSYFDGDANTQVTVAVVSGLLIFFTILYKININFYRAKGNVKLYDLLKLSRDLLEAAVLVLVFSLGGELIAGLSALLTVSIFLNSGMLLFVIIRNNIPFPNIHNFETYIKYGAPMIPKELSSKLLSDTDKYLLLYFLNPASVGIYAVAQTICRPLVELTGIFSSTLYPTIAQEWDNGNVSSISNIYNSIFRFYSIIGIPAMIGVVILAESLMVLLSTENIAEKGVFLVPVFIFGYFLKGYDNSIRYILLAAERTGIIGGSVVLTVLVNVFMNILLIPQFGMMGAAVATLISQSLLFGIILYYSSNEITVKIPWNTIGRSSLAALTMGSILISINLNIGYYERLLIYPCLGILIYFTTLFIIGEFPKTEIVRIKTELKKIFS